MTEPDSPWIPQPTEDGSFTFVSEEFGEAFHSSQGAKTEAFQKFVQATELTTRAQSDRLRLLDVCYGLGYNTAAALEAIWAVNPACLVEVVGLELDASVPRAAIAPPLLEVWSAPVQAVLRSLALEHHCYAGVQARLLMGDARQTIQQLGEFKADAIFFDPFSPRRCPQLWTVEFFGLVAQHLALGGKLATYSRAASVRSAMRAAGLHIGTIPITNPQRSHEWALGTVGAWEATGLHPLSPMEQEHLQTRAAIAYRDPDLSDSATEILARHDRDQQRSPLESTSSWRRRWSIE